MAGLDTPGKRIRALREELGLSQSDLVDRLRRYGVVVGRTYISVIEGSERVPSGEVLVGLARALGTTTDYLLLLTTDRLTGLSSEDMVVNTLGEGWLAFWQQVIALPGGMRAQLLDLFLAQLKLASAIRREQIAELAAVLAGDARGQGMISALRAALDSGALSESDLDEIGALLVAFAEQRRSNSPITNDHALIRSSSGSEA